MEIRKAISSRRSIHDFKAENVDESKLFDIFFAAAWAPTHRMKEPWNVKLYQDEGRKDYAELVLESYERAGFFASYNKEKKQKMCEGIRDFLLSIPHHALIYLERDQDKHKFEEDYAAVCAYIQNVQLLAWEKGVGVLWTTSPYLKDEKFIAQIGLDPSLHKPVAVLQMGYPNRIPAPKERTSMENKIQIINKPFIHKKS